MDLNRTHSRRKAAQSRGFSASLRRLATRHAAPMLAVGALLSAGLSPASAISYTYGNTTGNFSTGFSPLFPSGVSGGTTYADSLTFGGTTDYTATDDVTTQLLINSLTFSNSGNVTIARGGAGTNNSLSLGGTNAYVNFANTSPAAGTGAVTLGLDLSFASSGYLIKSSAPNNASANPVITGAINLGAAANNITVALADTGGDAVAELALTGTVSGSGSLTLANNATVPAGITLANTPDWGTLLVTGANTYTGGTNINYGRLVVTNGSALGTGTVNIGQASAANPINGATTSGGTLQFGNGNYTNGLIPTGITLANNINLAGAISGDYGNGIQNNQGNNTLSGVVTLTAAQANIAVGGGSLTVSQGIGQASGTTASLVKNGGATLFLTNTNTYTGSTTINGGYIQVGTGGVLAGGAVTASSVLGSTSSIINNGGTNGGLTLNYSNAISLDVSTITGTPSTTTPGTFNNANGRITQAGPATLTLTGTGTQGGYFVNSGTLAVGTGANLTGVNYSSIGVNSGDTGTLNVTGTGSLTQNGDFNVGDNAGAKGTLSISGSGNVQANNLYIAKGNNSTGTVNISGGSLVGAGGGGAIQVGTGGNGSVGVVNQSGGAVSTTANELWIGNGSGSVGTYNISAGTLTSASWFAVGRQTGSTGTLNISGGSVTKTGGSGNHITVAGDGALETGTINQTGGTLTSTLSDTWIGENGNGVYNLSGGTGTFGVLVIDQGGVTGSASAVNLSGTGVLSTTQVVKNGVNGTGTINFNGGTLQAASGAVATGSGSFLGNLTAANVQANGVTIDTNGQNVTVTQALVHDTTAGAPALDGGLIKTDTSTGRNGILTLSGTNTYTGATKVTAGQLSVTTIASLGSGNLLLPSSATNWVNLGFTGTENIGALSFNLGSSFVTPGTYGSLTSTATNKFAAFSGSGILNVTAAPEPSQYAAFGLGLLGLGGLALRARRRSAS